MLEHLGAFSGPGVLEHLMYGVSLVLLVGKLAGENRVSRRQRLDVAAIGHWPVGHRTLAAVCAFFLQTACRREQDEDQENQAGRSEAHRAEAAITETATKKSNKKKDDQ